MYIDQSVVWSEHVQIQGFFQVQVQCVMYIVQRAKDEDLAAETGWFKFKINLKKNLFIILKYFLKTVLDYTFLKT